MTDTPQYRLKAVRVFTADFKRAVNFYTATIEMTPEAVNETEGYAVFTVGEGLLLIEAVDPADSEASDLIGRFVGASFSVDDIQRVYETLSTKGVRFTHPPRKQPWGGVMTHFHDPDENVLTLVQEHRDR